VADAGRDSLANGAGIAVLDGAASLSQGGAFEWFVTGLGGGTVASLDDGALPVVELSLQDDGNGGFLPAAAQLVLADANGVSRPDATLGSAGNLRPVVSTAARITTTVDAPVTLTASDYVSDLNGDALTTTWSLLLRPMGSAAEIAPGAALLEASSVTFAPDRNGLYLIQLAAEDGALTATPAVLVIEVINSAPVAVVADPDDTLVGEVALLDGAGSYDIDGDALSFAWTILSRPADSTATLADPTAVQVSFTPDRRGDYVFQLVVSDYEFDSDPVTVTLTAPNRAPVAVLEGPAEVEIGEASFFTAAGSSDPDFDALTYVIEVISSPSGSAPILDDLGSGEVSVVADMAGEYGLRATVSDGLATDSAELTFTALASNAAPVLGALNDVYTVEVGLAFALDLTGSYADGDPISFFATPLPLVSGMTLEAQSGEVRFRPEASQLGSYTFTVGVSDGTLTDEALITVEVVPADAGDTGIYGRVLDANDFAAGVLTPLANMPVRLRDAALMTETDADGRFEFGSLSAGGDQVIIEPAANGGPGGYLGTIRTITATENQLRDLSPDFLLVPLEEGCATVVAGQATELTGSSSGVSVSIPADSIQTVLGDAYQGEVCLGSLPEKFKHSGFDDDTQACRIYALDAPGAVFTQGMSVTAPNHDNLPETTRLEMWRFNGTAARFSRDALAGVDPGAATVSSTIASFDENALFTFLPQSPSARASASEPNGMQSLTPFNGDNATQYTLPGYTAFGQAQQVGFTYHSQAANPETIVAGDVTIADDASLPVTMSTRLDIGGLSISDAREWTPRTALNGHTPARYCQVVGRV